MIVAIHQPEHLPWLGFLHKIAQADLFVVLDNVAYRKNYFQNRNRIAGDVGPQWLTVPVLRHGVEDKTIRAVRINASARWRRKYIATLEQTYGRHPFCDRYLPTLASIIDGAGDRLADLNLRIIRAMLEWFDLRPRFVLASSLPVTGAKTELLVSICRAVGAESYLSGPSGRDYLIEPLFHAAGIDVAYEAFAHPTYPQCGGRPFVPYLSAIDALMNLGPDAARLIAEAHDAQSPAVADKKSPPAVAW